MTWLRTTVAVFLLPSWSGRVFYSLARLFPCSYNAPNREKQTGEVTRIHTKPPFCSNLSVQGHLGYYIQSSSASDINFISYTDFSVCVCDLIVSETNQSQVSPGFSSLWCQSNSELSLKLVNQYLDQVGQRRRQHWTLLSRTWNILPTLHGK